MIFICQNLILLIHIRLILSRVDTDQVKLIQTWIDQLKMAKELKGALLTCDVKCICHQCNCVTTGSAGIARKIFAKYPFSNIYKTRKGKDSPGTIAIRGTGKKYVVNMLAQYYPGKPKYDNDTKTKRKVWFKQCLNKLSKVKGLGSVAFLII